jgi:hypothetical protein
MAGELLEPRDMDPCATPLEIAPRRRLCPANAVLSSPATLVHFLITRAIESVSIGLVPIRQRAAF